MPPPPRRSDPVARCLRGRPHPGRSAGDHRATARPRAPAGALSAQPARARDGAAWLYQHRDRRVRWGGEHSQELRLAFRTAALGLLWCDCAIRKPSCRCAGSIPLQLRHAIRNCRWLPVAVSQSDSRQRRSPQRRPAFGFAKPQNVSRYTPAPTPSTGRASARHLVPHRCRLTHMAPRAQTPPGGRPRARGARHDQSGGR